MMKFITSNRRTADMPELWAWVIYDDGREGVAGVDEITGGGRLPLIADCRETAVMMSELAFRAAGNRHVQLVRYVRERGRHQAAAEPPPTTTP